MLRRPIGIPDHKRLPPRSSFSLVIILLFLFLQLIHFPYDIKKNSGETTFFCPAWLLEQSISAAMSMTNFTVTG